MPIAHISLPVTSLETSKTFYTAVLKPLGYEIYKEFDAVIGMAPKMGAPDFWMHLCPEAEKKVGKEGVKVQKTHIAFQGASKAMVRAFYEAALKAGAKDNGPPGERPQYIKGYYAAYVIDPDGNNVECLYFQPLWLTMLQNAPTMMGVVAVGVAWWAGKQGWMMG